MLEQQPPQPPGIGITIHENKKREFRCGRCGEIYPYDYFGRSPGFCQSIVFFEDCYVMRDPFSEARVPLMLGANCSVCEALVCVGCSIYFARRFCLTCSGKKIKDFPPQLQEEIARLAADS